MARKLTAGRKFQMMNRLMSKPVGRKRIAASIQQPLRELRDYVAIGRKALMVDDLPDGTLPIYDKDIDVPAYIVGEEGDNVHTVIRGTRIQVPMFEMASNPTIPFTQVKERRFDIVSRIKKKGKDEIFREEDAKIFAMFQVAGTNNVGQNLPISISQALFDMDTMADAFANVESHGLRVDKVFMNPLQFKIFRKAGRDYMDMETQRELLRTGYMGALWGSNVYMSREVPVNSIWCVTEPEYLGVLPVRIDLTIIPADEPAKRRFGWSMFQNLGMALHNAQNGLQQISITG